MEILEVKARNILLEYNGYNNQLLIWKKKLKNSLNFKMTKNQAKYIIKYHKIKPKVARKRVKITGNYSEKLMKDNAMIRKPESIWVEKILCESEKAYHIWGKIFDKSELSAFWVPKYGIISERKKFKGEVDYLKYKHRPPFEYQKEAIETLLANDKFILADDMGLGKSLSINTLVYTPYGKKKIGDIKINDKVIGSDGNSYNVTGVFPQGKLKTYKITFNDGYFSICSGDHLWKVYSNNFGKNTNNNRKEREIILTTEQMLDKNLELTTKGYNNNNNNNKNYKFKTYYKVKNGDSKWQIPIVKPINFKNNIKLPIEPYLLGLSLGDGYITENKIKIEVHKDDFSELLENYNLIEYNTKETCRCGLLSFNNELKQLKINNTHSWDKFIPEIYKYSSIEDRLSLLQGLMDTDGTVMKSKNGKTFNGTEYCTVSEQLADDIAEIVHSLGGIVRKKSRIPTYTYKGEKKKGRKCYRLNIKLPERMNPFRLKRKKELYNTPKKYPIGRYIKNIEPAGEHECVCISVDSPDKLYVTEHGIVTHNTTSSIIASIESKSKKVLIICPASLKINWEREIKNYTNKKVFIVKGSKWENNYDYYIINYDILKNFHTLKEDTIDEEGNPIKDFNEIKILQDMNFDLVIIDEAHYISNTNAKRTKIVNEIVKNIPKIWLLTGTPMTSRPINYFNLLRLVNSPLSINWQTYVVRYCGGYKFPIGNGKKAWSTNGATHLTELREATKNIILRRLKTDGHLDLPDKVITPIFLELHNTEYNEELEEFIKISNEEKGNESIAITLNRLMPIRRIIANEKIPYTKEIIDKYLEQDKKIIVFTNFTSTLENLKELYLKNSVFIDGRMDTNQKQEQVDKFQNNKKIKIMIANLIAGGIGNNLTKAECVIMNDLCFVPSTHTQAEDRAFRIGQKKNVSVYYPIFDNTIERIIYNILNRKSDNIDQVMGDGEYSESFTKEFIKELF